MTGQPSIEPDCLLLRPDQFANSALSADVSAGRFCVILTPYRWNDFFVHSATALKAAGVDPNGAAALRLTVEMTLTADTAKMLKETGERLAAMNLGDDGLIAATVLMRIAADYERAVEAAAAEFIPESGGGADVRLKKPAQEVETIPLEDVNAENDE